MPTESTQRAADLKQKLSNIQDKIVVISGPSAGAGKGKVIQNLLQITDIPMWLSISTTTRDPRPEDHIRHMYNFVSADEFEASEAGGEFLEANGVTEGHRYGTPLEPILEHIEAGETVILELEINGAKFLREVAPKALFLFIKPTDGELEHDLAELRQRLLARGNHDDSSIDRRLAQAVIELKAARELKLYDEWVVNAKGHSDKAAERVLELIRAHARHSSEHEAGV